MAKLKSSGTSKTSKPKTSKAPRSSKRRIGIRDRLGRLTLRAAYRLLGDDEAEGEARFRRGAIFEINIAEHVFLGEDMMRVTVPDTSLPNKRAIVTIVEKASKTKGMQYNCDQCQTRCVHIAAVFRLVMEDKLALGLSAAPDPSEPVELLTDAELLRRAIADREERAKQENMLLRSVEPKKPWTDYTLTSRHSGSTYRVSLRGMEIGESYCSCPDFRTNHLGTCKHVIHAQQKVQKRFSKKELANPYRRENLSLRMDYGQELGLRFNLPDELENSVVKTLGSFKDSVVNDVTEIVRRIRTLERKGIDVHIYPDAQEFIAQRLDQIRLQQKAEEIRRDPENNPLRTELLDATLLPYQLDGIAFAVGAGRAVLADDMGLGKTIQGIGVAELLGRLAEIQRVLVVLPRVTQITMAVGNPSILQTRRANRDGNGR